MSLNLDFRPFFCEINKINDDDDDDNDDEALFIKTRSNVIGRYPKKISIDSQSKTNAAVKFTLKIN